jgi:hypothetical protein
VIRDPVCVDLPAATQQFGDKVKPLGANKIQKLPLGRIAAYFWMSEALTDGHMPDWSRFDLSVQEIKKKIEELNVARWRRRKWLAGTSFCVLGITLVSLLIVRNAAMSLLQDGPTHDEFVADLTHQVTRQVLPQMDESGIQASFGTLPLPDAISPNHDRTSVASAGVNGAYRSSFQRKESPSTLDTEKANIGICGAADDPQKPLGRFREQTVTEYQATVTKIINDLATIRGREGNANHAGLSAIAVASLFVSHVEDGLPKPSVEDNSLQTDPRSSKDTR